MGRLESEALFHLEFSCLFPHPFFLLLNNKYHVAFNFFFCFLKENVPDKENLKSTKLRVFDSTQGPLLFISTLKFFS